MLRQTAETTEAATESCPENCDVLVIGGGHAGVEAAAAAARCGARTLLISKSRYDLGVMSCNPAFGGLGKGHLLREVDALDGLLARAADKAAIHYRLLGRSRGPAVRGPRAQADRQLFAMALQGLVAQEARLQVLEGAVSQLFLDAAGAVAGAILADGRKIFAGALVLASGTFLGGRLYCGREEEAAGRLEELAPTKTHAQGNTTKARIAVNDNLRDWFAQQAAEKTGLRMIRLKTGTPPRLAADSLVYEACSPQAGDSDPCFLSFLTDSISAPQSPCYLTRTNPETHALVRRHLEDSAVGLQSDLGLGPRYCPSLEDKVVRFADRESHTVFLEPEGRLAGQSAGKSTGQSKVQSKVQNTEQAGLVSVATETAPTVYPNGISNALPRPVQEALVRTIAGLEKAQIVRYGYAVSYNAFDPRGLGHDLESLALPRLFLAGQINGTTGYEEAAAQGVLAGVNAARKASGATSGVELAREDSYIGVMVDDLVTRGVSEPYRMLTARAEFRLSLRADNADLRLTPKGEAWGVVGRRRSAVFAARRRQLEAAKAAVSGGPSGDSKLPQALAGKTSWQDLTRHHAVLAQVAPITAQTLEADLRYAPYLARQTRERNRLHRSAALRIPRDFPYNEIAGLGHEACESLSKHRPATLAAALVLEGVSPAAVSLLAAHLNRKQRRSAHGVERGKRQNV